jgi:hypothetical protein
VPVREFVSVNGRIPPLAQQTEEVGIVIGEIGRSVTFANIQPDGPGDVVGDDYTVVFDANVDERAFDGINGRFDIGAVDGVKRVMYGISKEIISGLTRENLPGKTDDYSAVRYVYFPVEHQRF